MNYLILSRKHTKGIAVWWRPGAAGYTNNLDTAGRYSKEDVDAYCLPSHGDDFAIEELQAYKLATRVIVDMGDGANNARLMSPSKAEERRRMKPKENTDACSFAVASTAGLGVTVQPEPTFVCAECGMTTTANEYHPYAACLMFKGCHDSETVRANLDAAVAHGAWIESETRQPPEAALSPEAP